MEVHDSNDSPIMSAQLLFSLSQGVYFTRILKAFTKEETRRGYNGPLFKLYPFTSIHAHCVLPIPYPLPTTPLLYMPPIHARDNDYTKELFVHMASFPF